MAKHYSIARPYARALFELALEHKQLDEWQSVLTMLSQASAQSDLTALWKDPSADHEAIATLFLSILKDALGESAKLAEHLVPLLVQQKRLDLLEDIATLYQQLLCAHQSVRQVEITSAFDVNDAEKEAFKSALEKRFSSKVNLSFNVDPSLLGGAILRSDHWVMDGSLKGKLARLKDSLNT